ncbi:uncharacterized protein GGS22DRAFT_158107 [Annulohypoxylon maeteangense]|uniref:uncharacterized protein n=1 Tax=Annulohypoxylon maeteangense TaxID=1927788 RepID=UPI00200783C1|nr:uncharacterized protein GGS22DRAFT_158107 [Annulohypoxylon maeteangense]KAI0886536.1 hypothetical protein GGS22DRAFT_158107 [Annulohypoxylon maeteangense]
MQFRDLISFLAVVGAASAAPRPQPLSFDDVVILAEDGSYSIVKEAEYADIVARNNLQPASPMEIEARTAAYASKSRRACGNSNEVQVTSDTKFLNWDVAMSPVVSAQGGSASVTLSSGYMLANSVSITATEGVIVEAVLTATLSVSYTQTWTSTETQAFAYTVPEGQFGVVVSQPLVRRVQGNYISGCVDAPDKKVPFTSDTYTNQVYGGGLNWVQGVIRLCNSTTYPVPFCIGEGSHT